MNSSSSRWSTTRSLVSCGALGAVSFIVVFLIEGATRRDYSAWRHYVSQLALGDGGWMQIVNFLVCGSLMLAFSVGLWRALPSGRSGRLAAVLVGLFGIGLLVAGVFVTDPALGYPVGTSADAPHTLHGLVHGLAGLACFSLVALATFVLAWSLRRQPGWSLALAGCGVLVVIGFVASTAASVLDATGAVPNAPTGLFQRIAIIAGWGALAAVSWRLAHFEFVGGSVGRHRADAAASQARGTR